MRAKERSAQQNPSGKPHQYKLSRYTFEASKTKPSEQTVFPAVRSTLFIAGCGLLPLGQDIAGVGLLIAGSACSLLDALSAAARPLLWGTPTT